MNKIRLNNGIEMPQVGMGLFQLKGDETQTYIKQAIEAGYRLFDTASIYSNEADLGQAIKDSGIARENFFISSKVWIHSDGYEATMKEFETSLNRLGTDYIDLYLIHQPMGDVYGSWRALEELYTQGKIKAIGVSNFSEDRLLDFILNTKIVPAVNQIELHPFFHQSSLRKLMKDYGIQVQAWGPLCEGMKNIFQHPVLENIAKKHQKSIAQIALKWSVQMGNSVIPKSTNPVHLAENVALWDFELDQEDLDQIKQLDIGYSEIIDHKNLAVVKGLNLCLGSKKTHV